MTSWMKCSEDGTRSSEPRPLDPRLLDGLENGVPNRGLREVLLLRSCRQSLQIGRAPKY